MNAQRFKNANTPIVAEIEQLIGDRVLSSETLHGGDLSEVARLRLASGKAVVVKSGLHPDREARMLRKLAGAGVSVPFPIAFNVDVLVLQDLGPASSPNEHAWRALGTDLGTLHSAEGDSFGWFEDYAFGHVQIRNDWTGNWTEFWIEQRLMADAEALPRDVARKLVKLRTRLVEVLPTNPTPSVLHGDLWSGNVHFTAGNGAYLIDPASYYGHAEVDLAMLTLFGSPPAAFWAAYGPLADGWEIRRYAYQLWPALVHLRLFGSGYRSLVENLINAIGT